MGIHKEWRGVRKDGVVPGIEHDGRLEGHSAKSSEASESDRRRWREGNIRVRIQNDDQTLGQTEEDTVHVNKILSPENPTRKLHLFPESQRSNSRWEHHTTNNKTKNLVILELIYNVRNEFDMTTDWYKYMRICQRHSFRNMHRLSTNRCHTAFVQKIA